MKAQGTVKGILVEGGDGRFEPVEALKALPTVPRWPTWRP